MNYLCLVEAMNLDNLFSDCEDLSTIRGGGLSVLDIGKQVANRLGVKAGDMISGASQGVFRLSGNGNANSVKQRISKAIDSLPVVRHATAYSAVIEDPGDEAGAFGKAIRALQNDVRWQQMQAATVVYPKLDGSEVCAIDKVRPGATREGEVRSEFSDERKRLGRERRRQLLKEILDFDDFEVADDLGKLCKTDNDVRNLRDKIAVLRFDGNSFGQRYTAEADRGFSALQQFSTRVKDQQKRFFRALLKGSGGPIAPVWWGPYGVRMEILVYGGDEVSFVVPAWLGWRALNIFYAEAATWEGVTYSGGLVFCHHKTPIHSVRRLASGLVDEAKARGGRGSLAMYQVLESFDAIGRKLTDFLDQRFGFARGKGACLDLGAIEAIDQGMPSFHDGLSRRKLHDLVFDLIEGNQPKSIDEAVALLLENGETSHPGTEAKVRALHAKLGFAAFLHVLELWDYAGVEL